MLLISPGEPGIIGRPRLFADSFAKILSPIILMCSDFGPINLIPCASSFSTKPKFSDKKPYPGCTASAPETSQAEIIAGIFK